MNVRTARLALVPWLAVFAACSGDRVSENLGSVEEALSSNDRILGFEGTISGAAGSDWRPVVGTASSSTTHSEGSHSMALGGNQNPSAISAALTALGTLSAPPSIDVMFQSGYQPQGTYYGQAGLYFTCGTTINNQYLGNVQLHGPTGSFNHYTFPSLPQNVATALSNTNGCTVKVELNLSNTGTVSVLVDRLSFGQASGSGGTGGTGGGAGSSGAAGNSGAAGHAGSSGAGGVSGGGAGGHSGAGGSGGAGAGGAGAGGAGAGGKAGSSGAGAGGAGAGGVSGSGGAGAGGVGGAGAGGAGAGGKSGNGGAGGAGAGGAGAGAGGAGAGGAGASGAGAGGAGAGGTSGSIEFYIDLPVHVPRTSVALGTSGGALTLNDGVRILASPSGFSSASSVKTTTETNLGVSAEVLNLWSEANVVVLRDGAMVHGNLTTEGTVTTQANVHITGTETVNGTLTPIQHQSWTVQFPSPNGGPVNLDVSQVRTITPGAYAGSTLNSNAKLTLAGTGRYTLDGLLDLEPGSILDVDNTQGPVQIYASGGLTFRGTISPRDTTKNNILIGIAGTGAIPVDTSFNGILVAPHGDVTLGSVTAGHSGAIYARSINVGAHTDFHHVPFAPTDLCAVGAACDGLCQCNPGGACDDPGDCVTDVQCTSGECGGPNSSCTVSSQCAAGLPCNSNGLCLGCIADCTLKRCSASDGCGGVCTCGGSCNTSADCPVGLTCSNGACVDYCITNPGSAGCPAPRCPNGGCSDLGQSCTDDSKCDAGLVCGAGVGPRFGLAQGTNACWNPGCPTIQDHLTCGSPDAPCGLCASPPTACTTTADCPTGETCTTGNGTSFGLSGGSVCWPTICTTTARSANCGGLNAPCGSCDCATQCAGKTCGGDMSDGCGGQCRNLCADRQGGCTSDANCASGSVCILGGGPRVGLPTGVNVCLPAVCASDDPSRIPCGDSQSTCGACPTCTPRCDGRCGGFPDGCGGTCTAECGAGEACTSSGICMQELNATIASIPDGLGGTRTVTPLDPGVTSDVGATAAVFGVSDTGKANYRIPIEVPPGRGGVEPHLALTYGGTQLNGVFGVGWYLEGLSSVTRCTHRFAEDGYVATPSDATSDRFCLDGTHLISFGDYGADGTTYFPEFDAQTRVISYGDSGGGPDYFKVWHDNGLIYTYGGTTDSSVYSNVDTGVKRQWALSRVEDHTGNFMTVEYLNIGPAPDNTSALPDRGTREIVPSLIRYTGFDGPGGAAIPPSHAIELTPSDTPRPDAFYGYTYGAHTTIRTQRISDITTFASHQEVHNYHIAYGDEVGQPAQNGDSRVASVTECEPFGCKPPTQFEYYDNVNTPFTTSADARASVPFSVAFDPNVLCNDSYSSTPVGSSFLRVADTDGDGRDDIVYQYNSIIREEDHGFFEPCPHFGALSARWGTLRGQSGSFIQFNDAATQLREFGGVGSLGCDGEYTLAADSPSPVVLDARSILDWNLDGRVDFIDFRHAAPTSVEVLTYPGYQPAPINSNPRPSCDEPSTAGIVSFSVGDANGDGLPEIIGCAAGSTATSPLDHAVILNRSTLDPAVTTDYFSASTTFCTDTWADMDGDGIAEPVKRSTDPNNVGIVTAKLRADLRTATETTFSLPLGLPRFDLNGDGLDDVLASDTSTIVHIWLNTGNGFTEVPGGIYLIPPRLMAFAVGADLDHDGRDEVLIPLTDQVAPSELMSNANTWGVYDYEPSGLVLRAYIDTGAWAAIHPPSTFTPDYSNAVLGDFDGDGNLDFAVTGDHDDSDNLPVRVLRGQNGTSNLLKSVTDGMGKRIDISYSNAVYTPGSNCSPLRCETHPPNVVVSNHTISETDATGTLGTKTEQTYDYTYQDARTDLQNQRYLGFSKRTINERSGLLNLRYTEIYLDNSTSELGNEYPFAGHRTLVRVTDQDTAPILSDPQTISSRVTETEFNWQPHFGAGTTVTPLLNFSEMRLIDRARVGFEGAPVDNRVLTVHYAYQYDPVFNNLRHTTRSETTNTTLATKDVDVVYHAETSFLNDWLISLPETKTVTDSVVAAGQTTTTTRVESYSYYPYGALQQTIREPNDAYYRLQTDIGRDPYGNALTVTETSADSPAGPAQVRGQSFMYDADQAYPLTITNALGQVSYLDFDRRFGKRTLFADPNGIATQWAYDGFGREAVRQTPVTQTITQYLVPIDSPSVSARAVLKASSESTGYGVNVTYLDALGRTVKRDVTGLLGATVTTETAFDDAGRPAQRSRPHLPGDASQGIEQVTYDDSGQPAFVTLADQNTIQYGYATRATVDPATLGLTALPDNYVFFTSLTDPNGNTSINVVDQRGLLVASRDPNGSWVSVQHGPFGTTTTATAVTSTTQITPDKYGRTDTSVDPDRGTEHYVYNAWGQVQRYYTGAPLQHIRLVFDHDDLGRVTSVTGASSTATYTYDNAGDGGPNEIGRLVSTTSLDGSRRDYHYEAPILAGNRGFVASVTDTVAGQSMATSFSYNASGQVETVTYPGGDDPFEIQYQYDAGGHLAEIGNPGFSEVYWQLTGAHQGQRPATEVIGAYTTVKGYYDDTGLLQSITTIGAPVDGTNPTIQEVAFDYDPNGNLRDRTYYVGDTGTEEFVPDSLNRLTSVTKDGVSTFEAGYLTNGNIDTLTGTNGNFTYIFPTSGPVHAPYQGGNATHEYDATGNLQTRQGDSIVGSTQITTVDDFNRPIRVNFQNPAGSVEYDYQTTGERSRKSLSSGTEVLYSGDYERTTTAAGIEHKYRIVSPSGPVMEVSRDDTGQELSRVFLYLDPRGSPEVITDAAGNVLHQQRFSPFGMVDSPSWESTNPAVRRVTRGFGGHEHDPETGLVNMGARLYDPTIGSFASPDFGVQIPSWTQAYNRYSYGWNNPMNWVDPFGLQNESTFPDQTTEPGDVVIPPDVINATPPDVSTAPTSEPTADPLAEFSPEGAAGTSEAPTPMTVGPQPGADEERIRRILQDASDPDCVAASCGPRPDEFAFENTSNELNQPPTDAEVQRQEAWAERVRELTKSDRPLTPELTASDVAAVIPAVRTALGVERLVVEGLGIGAETVNNPIPKTLARVIPANISPTTLGKIGEADVFVTDAEAMSGLGARQIAKALGIPESSSGFNVYEFSSEGSSIASPINRLNPGFVGRGMTSGGAPEFVIPNGPIPAGAPRFVR